MIAILNYQTSADTFMQINSISSHTPETAQIALYDLTLQLTFNIYMSLEKSLNWVLI